MPDETPSFGEELHAELVECAVPEAAPVNTPLPRAPEISPTTQIAQATIEQTGADPPPVVSRG